MTIYETAPSPMSQDVIEGDATTHECADPQCGCHLWAWKRHPAVEVTLIHPVTGVLYEGWTAERPAAGEPYHPCIRIGEWVVQLTQYRVRQEPQNAQLTAYNVKSGRTRQSGYTARWWTLLDNVDPAGWHR